MTANGKAWTIARKWPGGSRCSPSRRGGRRRDGPVHRPARRGENRSASRRFRGRVRRAIRIGRARRSRPHWRPRCSITAGNRASSDEALARRTAERASAAAALELDQVDFGFPSPLKSTTPCDSAAVDGPADGADASLR